MEDKEMKKNIIIAGIAAASALLLSVSCQKENQPESQNGINGGAKTFTATIEQGLTKTTLTSENKVNWTTGDKININGVTFKATPVGTDATKATFAKDPDTQGDPTGETFKAIYPSTLYVTDHFELPSTQTYTEGEFNAPMYAQSTTQTLSFKNICAVLAITVTSDDINALKSIKVKSDKKLNGTFTVNSTPNGGYKAVIGSDGSNEVVLSMGETPIDPTTDGTTFYIAIPAQDYLYLKIYLSEDGTLYKRAMITKKAAGLGTIACNTIYNIAYETNAVQMYADGPYWSTMNLGATNPQDYGRYFQWGEIAGHECNETTNGSKFKDGHNFDWASVPFNNGQPNYDGTYFTNNKGTWLTNNVLKSDYDAAYQTWGSSWRMPTEEDFTALANACNAVGYTSGNISLTTKTTFAGVTAKGVYWITNYNSVDKIKGLVFCDGTNKLFFPAAGYGNGASLSGPGDGSSYWSSTLYSSSPHGAYRLFFSSSLVFPQGITTRFYGFPVRPVSD